MPAVCVHDVLGRARGHAHPVAVHACGSMLGVARGGSSCTYVNWSMRMRCAGVLVRVVHQSGPADSDPPRPRGYYVEKRPSPPQAPPPPPSPQALSSTRPAPRL
jgi:hypothetical protein